MLTSTFKRLMAGVIAAAALCVPGFANVVVDDLDDGDGKNAYGYYWYTYQSGYTVAIALTPSGDFVPTAGDAHSGTHSAALGFTGLQGAGADQVIGIGTSLTAGDAVGFGADFSNVDSIAFWAKGPSGLKFYLKAHTVDNDETNNNTYGAQITIIGNNQWNRYAYCVKGITPATDVGQTVGANPTGKAGDLKQEPYWGKAFTFNPARVTKLAWSIKKGENTSITNGTFAIDDVTLIGSIVPPTTTTPPPTTPTTTKYALTYKVNTEYGGSISVNNSQHFIWTDSVAANIAGPSVTAIPSPAYRFVNWAEDGNANLTRADIATENLVFTAVFEPKHTITYKAGESGALLVGNETALKAEHKVALDPGVAGPTVTAICIDPQYQFAKWSDGNVSPSRSDMVVDGNLTFTAEFEDYVAPPVYVKVAYTAGEGGSLRAGAATATVTALADSLAPGGSLTVTAVPNDGYAFFRWSDSVASAVRTDNYEGGAVNATAHFAPVPTDPQAEYFTLAYSAGNGGKIKTETGIPTSSITRSVAVGNTGPTITAVPDAGYNFVTWSDGSANASRTDTATADKMATAEFAQIDTANRTFTLSYTAGNGGLLSVGGNSSNFLDKYDTTVAVGATAPAIAAIADAGYIFSRWSDGSEDVSRIDRNVQADISLTAEFRVREVDIIAVASPSREIPTAPTTEISVVTPIYITVGGITAGPNPAAAAVKFFRTGRAIKAGKLSVYDASGSLVATIKLSDNGIGNRRAVGTWNLKDGKGREAANGSYAVRGSVTTKDGVTERVSAVIAVAK
jgi:hypothetical protein